MITNATLQRIDVLTGQTATGAEVRTTGAALAAPAFLDDPTGSQHWNLGATIKDASWVCYVAKDELAAAGVTADPLAGDKWALDFHGVAVLGQILVVKDRQLGSVSHWEVFLKRV